MPFTPGSFLPAGILQDARNIVNSSLASTCTIARKGVALDPAGTPAKSSATYATLYTGVVCRLTDYGTATRPRFDEVLAGAQVNASSLFILILEVGQDILRDDQVIVNGRTLIVLGTDSANTWQTGTHALVKEAGA